MPPLPNPINPHLKDNKAGSIDATKCHYVPTHGLGLPPLHAEAQEPEGIYLVQDKVEACHGGNRPRRLDFILLIRILPVLYYFPHSSSDESESLSDSDGESSSSPLPSK